MNSLAWRMLKVTLWLMVIALVLLLVVIPALIAGLIHFNRLPVSFFPYLSAIETWQGYAFKGFMAAWVFFLGSCFASFLNVVAWRIPRGQHILGSSHCPQCNNRLGFGDNMPIVGWIRNRGRCRNCRLPIPARYLIAEIILGTIFFLVVSVVVFGGGWNLPGYNGGSTSGLESVLMHPPWDRIQLAGYHLLVLSLIFTLALIEVDKRALPFCIVAVAVGLVSAAPAITHRFLVLAWDGAYVASAPPTCPDRWITLVAGGTGGWVAGWLIGTLDRRGEEPDFRMRFSTVGMFLAGIAWGWQSVIAISLLQMLFLSGRQWMSVGKVGPSEQATPHGFCSRLASTRSTWLLIASLTHLMTWRLQY